MSPELLGEAGAVGEARWDAVLGPLGAAAAFFCGPRPPAPRPSKWTPYLFINRLLSSHLPVPLPPCRSQFRKPGLREGRRPTPQVWRGRRGRKGNGQLGGSCRLVLSTEAAQRTFLLPAAALQLSVGRTSFISSWELYSLHSWCGILVFVLFFVQWLMGCSFFLFPGASFSLRSRYRPQHVFLGGAIFLLSVGTALLGLKEALLFKLGTKYSKFEPEGVLANVLGLLLAAFGAVVLYILTRADWKRPLQAEEQALSMDFKTLTEGDSPSSQ